MTAEEYLKSAFEPEAEFAEGVVVERNTGMEEHSRWQAALIGYFGSHAREWGVWVRPILRIKTGEDTYRVPDLAIFGVKPEEDVPSIPPVAVFEVLSPEDRFSLTMQRFAEFEAMGVRSIYLIDPKDDSCTRYSEGGLYFGQASISLANRKIAFQELVDALDSRQLQQKSRPCRAASP